MYGKYLRQPEIHLTVEDFDVENNLQCYGLMNQSSKEIKGPTYQRKYNSDLEYIDGSYRLSWQPTKHGEIWAFNVIVMYEDPTDNVPSAGLAMPYVVVLYGSLQGEYHFWLHHPDEVVD